MDHIYIRDLQLETVIGVFAEERRSRQVLTVNLDVELNFGKELVSDDFRDAVNYSLIEGKVHQLASKSEFFLLEKLAFEIAGAVLTINRVQAVTVTVDKPRAPRHSRSIAVSLRREKS